MSSESFIGIDVSQSYLDVNILPNGQTEQFANTEAGITQLLKVVKATDPKLIVFESTGGLEFLAISILSAKHYPVVVVNARQVRDFAKATGKLAWKVPREIPWRPRVPSEKGRLPLPGESITDRFFTPG